VAAAGGDVRTGRGPARPAVLTGAMFDSALPAPFLAQCRSPGFGTSPARQFSPQSPAQFLGQTELVVPRGVNFKIAHPSVGILGKPPEKDRCPTEFRFDPHGIDALRKCIRGVKCPGQAGAGGALHHRGRKPRLGSVARTAASASGPVSWPCSVSASARATTAVQTWRGQDAAHPPPHPIDVGGDRHRAAGAGRAHPVAPSPPGAVLRISPFFD